jgi:hypothetical protein
VALGLEFGTRYPEIFVGIDVSGDQSKNCLEEFMPVLKMVSLMTFLRSLEMSQVLTFLFTFFVGIMFLKTIILIFSFKRNAILQFHFHSILNTIIK